MSTPHRSETNGIAERAVRRVKEGTSAVLLQSGLNESWWADSMECYTNLRNVTDILSDGKTPYEKRFGEPFKGPIIPFGSLVDSYLISAKDQSRIHQFGKKVLPGLFLGYALYAGRIWKGDVLIADLEELETTDASEIYSKRLNAKEVILLKQGEFIFPIADGRIKTPGGDQELRTSTLVRHRPIQGDGHVDFLGESEGSLPQPHDSFPDAGEAINDFWSMSGSFKHRHHVEPRVKLYSPREESFPIPLKYIDVSRTTHTNLDVMQERRIDDYWNIDGSRDLSGSWTGFTQFTLLEEKAPDGYMWSGERWPGDAVPKAGLQQAAADSQGSRTCVCANTQPGRGGTRRGGKDELTSCRGTVQSSWQKPPVRRKGGRAGLPARVSGRHVVRGRQSSPTLEVRLGEARLVKTVNIQVRWAAAQPGQDRRLPNVATHSRL